MDNIDQITIAEIKPDTADSPTSQRVGHKQLDDIYIDAFLDNPASGPLAAYRVAIDQAGLNVRATKQGAFQLHERLRTRINETLVKLSDSDKALGRKVLRDLATSAKAESVKASCAQTLAKGLYPDVKITKDMTKQEIDDEVQKLQAEYDQAQPPVH